jgi:hypothetical protein
MATARQHDRLQEFVVTHTCVPHKNEFTSIRTKLKMAAFLTGIGISGAIGGVSTIAPPARAAPPPKPAISEEANAAVAQMGKSLLADQFSFQAKTLRVYADSNGQPLHIAHAMKVTVHRPDRLLIDLTGDDGSTRLFYDSKTVVIFGVETKKYASLPVPNTIQGMLETMMGERGFDFPLADLITNAPDKSFLLGITTGKEVGTATIDGVPCRHLLFTQRPGIEIELWVEKNDRALPRRLIVTYRSQPGQPSYVAELFDWNFAIHPTDADFVFRPPAGAEQTQLIVPGQPAPKQKAATQ